MKKFILFILCMCLLKIEACAYAVHQHSESSYQHAWCAAHNGIEEYKNNDKTRVDCLTKDNAVEFDFANKWAA